MFALKAANRFSSTCGSVSIPRSALSRYLSSDAPAPSTNVHEVQSKERERSLRSVREEQGAIASMVAQAVKNTERGPSPLPPTKEQRLAQAKRQLERKKAQQQRDDGSSSSTSPRPSFSQSSSTESRLGASLSTRRSPGGHDAQSLLRGNADRRPFNPRVNAAGSDSSRRSPRFPANASSPSSGPRRSPSTNGPGGPRPPRTGGGPNNKNKPKGARRSGSSSSTSTSIFSPEDTKPLTPPPGVRYPSVNLAQLVRAELAAKALQVKRAVGQATGEGQGENSEDEKVRQEAKKVLMGDYSNWTHRQEKGQSAGGKKGSKNGGVVDHAQAVLSRNSSVGLEGRQVFINKLKESLS